MISVVIPTYNEETQIHQTLCQQELDSAGEVIVVDGRSQDATCQSVDPGRAALIQTFKRRSHQLNLGADAASGDILLFLHADSILEGGTCSTIVTGVQNGLIGGCLTQRIASPRKVYRLIERTGNLRARMSRIFYGDQAIFITRKAFDSIGGFDDVDLFDDVLFSQKMKNHGPSSILPRRVWTSPRRWQKQGVFKTTFINWLITIGFLGGIPIDKLKKYYIEIR
jgi:rSAM/selenodomain-associated transferase 2